MNDIKIFLVDWFINLLTGQGDNFINGLFIGIVFTLFFIIIYKIISLFTKSSYIKGIKLKNASGTFYVTQDAIKNLITKAISPLEAVEILDVRLFNQAKKITIELSINIKTLNNVDTLRYHLEQQILTILAENFSIRHNIRVNISVKKFLVESMSKQLYTPTDILTDTEKNEPEIKPKFINK